AAAARPGAVRRAGPGGPEGAPAPAGADRDPERAHAARRGESRGRGTRRAGAGEGESLEFVGTFTGGALVSTRSSTRGGLQAEVPGGLVNHLENRKCGI